MALVITVHGVPGPLQPNLLQPDFGGLALRRAAHELLHFLEVERSLELSATASQQGSNQSTMPPYDVFKPACVAHTRKLTKTIDMAYSDAQLETVLENECSLDKMFISVETGFNDYDACKRFAKLLTNARDMELKDGSVEGYEKFCEYYYEYKGKLEKSGQVEDKTTRTKERKKEKRVIYESQANTTNNTKGYTSIREETEAGATQNNNTEVTEKHFEKELRQPPKKPKKRVREEPQKGKDVSWGLVLMGFGIITFIIASVIVSNKHTH